MATKLLSPQSGFRVITAIARWLPTAPANSSALAAGITALLAKELPALRLTIAVGTDGSWELHGVTSRDAHLWLAQLRAQAIVDDVRVTRSPTPAMPPNSIITAPHGDTQVAVAVWNQDFSPAAFEALAAQIAFAYTTLQDRPSVSLSSNQQARELLAVQRIAHELHTTPDMEHVLGNVLAEVLEVGHLLRADRPVSDTLTDIAYGIVNALDFRSIIINLRSESDPAFFKPVAFAGVLPDDVQRLRDEPIAAKVVEELCADTWKLSCSYLIPAEAVAQARDDGIKRVTAAVAEAQRQNQEWQATDILITPLTRVSGEMIGFISAADHIDRRRPTWRVAEAIEIFANQAIIAVENVHVYNASQRRLAEQNALNRIQQAISASLDVRHILRAVYEGLQSTLPIDSYYSLIYDQDNPDLGVAVSVDEGTWSIEQIRGLDQYRGLHAYMMQLRQPLLFTDLRVECATLPSQFHVISFGDDSKRSASWMGVPLIVLDNELIGAISVHSYTPHQFGPSDLAFLQAVAHQVNVSFLNARLFAERERRLHEVNVVNQLAQALAAPISLDELAEVLYVQISQALGATSLILAVHDRKYNLLDFPLVVECGKRRTTPPFRTQQAITSYILQTRQPLLLNDNVAQQLVELGVQVDGELPSSFAGTPLLVGDEAVGVLAMQDDEHNHAFGDCQLRLLHAIALQIASGIEKARLLKERERQIEQMQTLNNIGKVTSSTLDLNDLFNNMYVELSRYRKIDTLLLTVCEPESRNLLHVMTITNGQMHRVDYEGPIQPDPYTDVVTRTAGPLLIRDTREEKVLHGIALPPTERNVEPLSLVCVPLLNTHSQPCGMLSMQSGTAADYDLRDVDFLTNVANQITLAIQNAALFKQTQEQVTQLAQETERLELINRVSDWTSWMLDANELLRLMVTEMARMTNADQVRLMMFDRERNIGICQAEYKDTGSIGQMTISLDDNPLVAWMDQQQTPLLVSDVVHDPQFAAVDELLQELKTRDLLIVPLVVKGEVIGSVRLDTQDREHRFTELDIATCATIANQVATAVDNARLWKVMQQSVRELTMLYDLSMSLTTMLNLDEILGTLATAALEVERADLGAIILFDDQGRPGHFAGITRFGDLLAPEPFTENVHIQRMMHEPKPLVVTDVNELTPLTWLQLDIPTQSGVMMPIVIKGQAAGVLVVAAQHIGLWSERERSLLSILAGQAATAIENAYLFTSEQEKRRLADTLREVALSLTSTLDIRKVLEIILIQLRRVVPYDSTSVQLLRDDNQLQIISGHEFGEAISFDDMLFPADRPEHPNHHVVETQQPYIVHDTEIEYPIFKQTPCSQHVRSWLGVPLIYGSKLLGMITLDSRQPNFYTSAMADVALMFATQAAQAIAHARLFDQIKQFNVELEQMVKDRTAALTAEKERLEAVHTITTALTLSLDIDEIVPKMLELAASAIGVNRGSVLIRDPMREILVYRAVLTENQGLIRTSKPFDLPPGNLVQWTIENQQGVVIEDVRTDPRWVTLDRQTHEIRSFIAVPLLAADVPLGVLMLNSRTAGYFNDEHLRLLSTIASEVAIAVHNAELYNYINEQATRLAELLQIQREETGKNRAILESIAEGVMVLDEHGSVVLFNQAASEVLQIDETHVVGRMLPEIAAFAGDEDQARVQPLYEALADGVRAARQQPQPVNRLLELPGQTIDMTSTPVTTPEGDQVGVAVVLRDITREIEADKAKREFISTVSHELRTPLTSVKGYVDLLMLGTAGPISDMQKSFLQIVKSNADRLNGLVEDLLEISRLENGKVTLNVKPIKLSDLIVDIVSSLRTETDRKQLQLVLAIEDLPTIEGDPKRINQILTNLLSNAHKYTRDGGQITVRVFQHGGQVQVDVVDTGVGIPPDDLPKMFSRFFRANNALKDEVGGTGLGLSIAKSFVELHGGDMWVISEIDVGSTFSFTLPLEYRRPSQNGEGIVGAHEVVHAI